MHKRKFIRKVKQHCYNFFAKNYYNVRLHRTVLEKVRGRERVTGKRITLRQISSPEQFPTKILWCHHILASPRQCIFFFFFKYWKAYDRFTITGTSKTPWKGKKNNTTKQKQTNKETPTKPIASSFFVRAFWFLNLLDFSFKNILKGIPKINEPHAWTVRTATPIFMKILI